jgi:hypothetical protein
VGLLFREQGKQRAQRCFPALFDFGLAFRATQSDSGHGRDLKIVSEKIASNKDRF